MIVLEGNVIHLEWGVFVGDKKERLKNAIEVFEKSEHTTEDYMNLFYIVARSVSQGDGLLWSTVEEVVNDVLQSK